MSETDLRVKDLQKLLFSQKDKGDLYILNKNANEIMEDLKKNLEF